MAEIVLFARAIEVEPNFTIATSLTLLLPTTLYCIWCGSSLLELVAVGTVVIQSKLSQSLSGAISVSLYINVP